MRLALLAVTLLTAAACGGAGGLGSPADAGNTTTGPGFTWTAVSGAPSSTFGYSAVAYGNQRWVAVGTGGVFTSSPDATTWTQGSTSLTNYFYGHAVAFANGLFVELSQQGISTTADGQSWSRQNLSQAQALAAVVYGGTTWVVVDDHSFTNDVIAFWLSPNGSTWTSLVTTIPYAQPTALAYGNGTFVLVGYGSLVATSPDGRIWTQQSLGASDGLTGVAYGGGAFLAMSTSGTSYRSTDGRSWASAGSSSSSGGRLVFGSSTFVTVGATGGIAASVDGASWKLVSGGSFNDVAAGNNQFLAVGHAFGRSP
jgi:hypothetical protein